MRAEKSKGTAKARHPAVGGIRSIDDDEHRILAVLTLNILWPYHHNQNFNSINSMRPCLGCSFLFTTFPFIKFMATTFSPRVFLIGMSLLLIEI